MGEDPMYQDGTYLQNNPDWHVADSFWKAQEIIKIVHRNNLHPATIADVGCGAGEVLVQVIGKSGDARGYGYEISKDAFALCEARSDCRVSFLNCDIMTTSDRHDMILAIDVFEHVADYLGFLSRLRLHGQTFVFHIPLDLSVQSVLRASPIAKLRDQVGHLHYFTKETAVATLRHSGYTILDMCYTEGVATSGNHLTLKNRLMRLPRRVAAMISPDLAVRVLGGRSLLALCQ